MKVLLIDDSFAMRSLQRHCLSTLDVTTIVEAESGEAALELFQSETFDLVLCDIGLPGMSGLVVLERLREMDDQVPIVMVTADGRKEQIMDAARIGCSDYITKPFSPEEYVVKMQQWCTARA